jgi:hypothetical protein
MNALAPISARLAKLIPLLASDKAGEVAATVEAIKRVLGTVGADFHDLARALVGQTDADDEDWELLVERLLDASDRLSDRDIEFLWSMRRHVSLGRTPTPKQAKWLRDIDARLSERAA